MELTKEIATEMKRGVPATTIHQQLVESWGESAPGKGTVCRWYTDLKTGRRTSFEDAEKEGRPRCQSTEANWKLIKQCLEDIPSIGLHRIEELTSIPRETARRILHDNNYRKISSVWIPNPLTEARQENRLLAATDFKSLFASHQDELLHRRLIIVDESWLFFTPKRTRYDNKVWASGDKPRPRIPQCVPNVPKTLILLAFTHDGKFHVEGTEKGDTIDSERYCEFLQNTLDSFRRIRGKSVKMSEVIVQHDNARPHTSETTNAFLSKKGIRMQKQSASNEPWRPSHSQTRCSLLTKSRVC